MRLEAQNSPQAAKKLWDKLIEIGTKFEKEIFHTSPDKVTDE
jgi:hypothetical protein